MGTSAGASVVLVAAVIFFCNTFFRKNNKESVYKLVFYKILYYNESGFMLKIDVNIGGKYYATYHI